MITAEILLRAHQQFGVVSRRQLIEELGVSSSALYRARRAGLLVPIAHNVVRVASSPETFEMRCMAAQLSSRGAGFLSAWTCARLRGLRRMPSQPVHLTLPRNRGPILPAWVEEHRSQWFDRTRDRECLSSGLIVATPLRMLFGLAAHFNQFRFERAAEDAWHLRLTTPQEVAVYLDLHRCRGKDGVSTIERWLDKALGQERPAQSELERELLDAIRRVGLPTPTRQHRLALSSGEHIHVDIAWPPIRLGVEPGASWWHGGDAGQRRDQARDRGCSEVGWMIIRFDETLRRDSDAAASQIARIYAERAASLPNWRGSWR